MMTDSINDAVAHGSQGSNIFQEDQQAAYDETAFQQHFLDNTRE